MARRFDYIVRLAEPNSTLKVICEGSVRAGKPAVAARRAADIASVGSLKKGQWLHVSITNRKED